VGFHEVGSRPLVTRACDTVGNLTPGTVVSFWDIETGRLLRSFRERWGHKTRLSPDGSRRLAFKADNYGHVDPIIYLWDGEKCRKLSPRKGSFSNVRDAIFSADYRQVISITSAGELTTWDVPPPPEEPQPPGHPPGGHRSNLGDGLSVVLKKWDGGLPPMRGESFELRDGDGKFVLRRPCSGDFVRGHVSRDRSRVLILQDFDTKGDRHTLMACWNVASGEMVWKRRLTTGPPSASPLNPFLSPFPTVVCAVISGDGSRVAVGIPAGDGGKEAKARILDGRTGEDVAALDGSGLQLWGFTPDGSKVLGMEGENTFKAWDAATGRELLRGPGFTDTGIMKNVSPQYIDRLVVLLRSDIDSCDVRVLDLESGKTVFHRRDRGRSVDNPLAKLSRDGSRIAVAWNGMKGIGACTVYEVASGKELFTLRGHSSGVGSIEFSPDDRRIVTAPSLSNEIKFWETRTGREVLHLSLSKYGVELSPDGTRLKVITGESSHEILDGRPLDQR
jgi:WD40 repeat protein